MDDGVANRRTMFTPFMVFFSSFFALFYNLSTLEGEGCYNIHIWPKNVHCNLDKIFIIQEAHTLARVVTWFPVSIFLI